jgi:hypothetical protein
MRQRAPAAADLDRERHGRGRDGDGTARVVLHQWLPTASKVIRTKRASYGSVSLFGVAHRSERENEVQARKHTRPIAIRKPRWAETCVHAMPPSPRVVRKGEYRVTRRLDISAGHAMPVAKKGSAELSRSARQGQSMHARPGGHGTRSRTMARTGFLQAFMAELGTAARHRTRNIATSKRTAGCRLMRLTGLCRPSGTTHPSGQGSRTNHCVTNAGRKQNDGTSVRLKAACRVSASDA